VAKKPKRFASHIELNMVPMIDVVFSLLIFLMIMPSSSDTEGYLPTNLPTGLGQQKTAVIENPKNQLRIDLYHLEPYDDQHLENKAGVQIHLNNEILADNRELRSRLKQAHAALANSGVDIDKIPVLISPDMGVYHKHVVAAFDATVDAGFKNIQFTVPK
jgi:biopolymer transport protein ExbD